MPGSKTTTRTPRKPGCEGVFFNSLPKSGKNLVYTFFSALQYERVSVDEAFNASIHDLVYAERPGKVVFSLDRPLRTVEPEFSPADSTMAALEGLKSGQIAQKHLPYCAAVAKAFAKAGRRSIFVWRDPRDVLVSMLNYARSQSKPELLAARLAGLDDETALIALLEGRGDLTPFADYVGGFLGWIDQPGVLTVCFEDLVGPEGGGSKERQRRTFEEICRHFDVDIDPGQLEFAAGAAFNRGAGTFFKGRSGAWRDHFTPKVTKAFQAHVADLLTRWRLWRLERLEAYAHGLDERYTALDGSHTSAIARAEAAEREIEAVAIAVDTDLAGLDEPLAKIVSRRISALEALTKTTDFRLEQALASIEAASRRYKELEQEFTKRAEAMNALRAEFVQVSETAKIKEKLSTLAQKLDLDPDDPLPAIKHEIDHLRASLANAEAQLAGWIRRGEALEASKAQLQDKVRSMLADGEAARQTLLGRLAQRDEQMAALEARLAETSRGKAEQAKAFEAMLEAAADQKQGAQNRVEERDHALKALKKRLTQAEAERRSLVEAMKDSAVRSAERTQAYEGMLDKVRAEKQEANARALQRSKDVEAFKHQLEKVETQRRTLAERLSSLAAASNESREQFTRLLEKNASDTENLMEKLRGAQQREQEMMQALAGAQAGSDFRRELDAVAARLDLDPLDGSPAAALEAAVQAARAALETRERENAALRERLSLAEAANADLTARLKTVEPGRAGERLSTDEPTEKAGVETPVEAEPDLDAGSLQVRS